VEDAVRAVRAIKNMPEAFDHAFGRRGVGVTAERLGEALASYLRSVRPPESPYRALLEGEDRALEDHEWRGRAIFAGPGRCDACHAGEAFSDGLFHAAFTSASFRAQRQREGSRERISQLMALAAQQPEKKRRPPSDPLLPRPLPDVGKALV